MVTMRHKVFVSYHQADEREVNKFITDFGSVFITKALGTNDRDDFIESDDTDYVMRRISELYLTDSTVTIVLVGKCTWSRKYVDWEVASSLRNDIRNKRNGLLAIQLPSAVRPAAKLPDRVSDNVDGERGYARYWTYPASMSNLRNRIDIALAARDTLLPAVARDRRRINSAC